MTFDLKKQGVFHCTHSNGICHTDYSYSLRAGSGRNCSSPEHTQIEGTGGGRMEYIHGFAEHTTPRSNKDSRRQLREYHRAINEQEQGERNRQGVSPGKGYIRLKPLTTDSLRASIPPSENMAYGPGVVPGTHDVYRTLDDCYRVVHMKGSNVPSTNIDSTEAEGTRRLELN